MMTVFENYLFLTFKESFLEELHEMLRHFIELRAKEREVIEEVKQAMSC